MSLQEIIVIVIVFFCVSYIGIKIKNYLHKIKNNDNPCANCNGCDLKRMMDKKKEGCKELTIKKKKGCCE